MSSRFVHLHTHSHYSLLEALPKIKDYLKHIKAMGMDAVALTDNGAMYGAIEFYQKALEAGVKPIIGVDFYLAAEDRHLKRAHVDTKPYRLVCLAETNEGYHNLMKLSSIGFLEGFYYKPRIDKKILREYTKGLIALSGGHLGEIDDLLRRDKTDEARITVQSYVEMFGKGNFFLELVDRPEIAEQEAVNAKLISLGQELDVPMVATKNTFYIKPQDVEAWKILNCIKGGKTLEHFDRLQAYDYDASMVSGEYMIDRFADVPEAIANTGKIADRCNVTLDLGKWNFAQFIIPEEKTFREVLTERTFAGLKEKVNELSQIQIDRLNYELDIIDQKGFCPYFLIVSDFLSWSRDQGIVTTTRGSAAGSLVAYATDISAIDPLLYQLPFERFLNPERPSAPDIDADFADNRRDEVLDYVRQKYGTEKVAQICTFGTMLARGSVRDVGRSLGFVYGMVDQIAKLVPMGSQGFPMTLLRALDESPDLKKMYDTDANARRIIDLARQIEGCARHVSVHAAGTVISPSELTDFTPLQIDTREGKVITQYEMKSVESAGLVKMDFLGIRNLSILGDAVALVKKTKEVTIDIDRLPVDDKKTFTLLTNGHTMGVFQLNGEGMTKYLMELKPSRIEDIMAMVALYRPGPIESIPEYIKRKHDSTRITYLDPRMKEILNMSYGVIVYQDDVMLIAIHLGGYTWLEADKLRKAMGKKIPEEMAKQKIKLHEGFLAHGLSEKKAKELWLLIEPFAAYGFNKSHAASYGMVAYQTAYMKANYPAEYMTALMTAESGDLEKIAEAVVECRRFGIEVLPPDINESRKNFTYITDQQIRFGLLVIKNLGEEVVESILTERKVNGEFKNLADFVGRVSHRAFNKKSLEALIKTGALDRFGERNQLLENLDRLLLHNKNVQKEKLTNQQSLFGSKTVIVMPALALRPTPAAQLHDVLLWEKELLGLYLSGHPYAKIHELMRGLLVCCQDLSEKKEGSYVYVGGIIGVVKPIVTKKGEAMAFVQFEDMSGQTELIVFPKVYAVTKDILTDGRTVLVSAKVSRREGEEPKLLANSFVLVDDNNSTQVVAMLKGGNWLEYPNTIPDDSVINTIETKHTSPALVITLQGKPTPEIVAHIRTLFQEKPGITPVSLQVESGGSFRKIETEYRISPTETLLVELRSLVGAQNVELEK